MIRPLASDRPAGQDRSGGRLLLKRGQRGRYRFNLRGPAGAISGEVFVPDLDRPRAEQESEARQRIRDLVLVLLEAIGEQ